MVGTRHAYNLGLIHCLTCRAETVWRISRPSYNQREFYNGHKQVHSLKYQAIVTPE